MDVGGKYGGTQSFRPEQIYQFKHPETRRIYGYRASELQQAIGRWFSNVDFIPARPRDFEEAQRVGPIAGIPMLGLDALSSSAMPGNSHAHCAGESARHS
jgi:hypothetical protein